MEARFVLDVEEIDRQHGTLFAILGRVHDALLANDFSAGPTIREAVAELLDRTSEHFASEEAIMEAADYPALAAHREMHRNLLAEARDIEIRADSEAQFAPTQLAAYLHTWLAVHILAEDKAFTDFYHTG